MTISGDDDLGLSGCMDP